MYEGKRLMDVCGASLGLIGAAPLLVLIGLVVRLTSPGPVLYRARRVGKGGGEFALLKFRTMVDGAAKIGPPITVARDPRVTPVGGFLRRTKLDELPALWNVLRGEMSLVGPRPEDVSYASRFQFLDRGLLNIRPGITSPASLKYVREADELDVEALDRKYVNEVLPTKERLDGMYVKGCSLASDLAILLRTPFAILEAWSDRGE